VHCSQRVINFAVRGRCQTFNLWSGKRPAGTPVFFIVKKVPVKEGSKDMVWCFVPTPTRNQPSAPVPFGSVGEYHAHFPHPDSLCWEEDGRWHVGAAVRVGVLGDNTGDVALDPKTELYKQGLFKTSPYTMPVTTELFLRI